MSGLLQSLLEVALVGTQRQSVSVPPLAGELGALLSQVAGSNATPQKQLLQMAGAVSICSRAGFQAAAPSAPAWIAAAPDTAATPDTSTCDLVLRPILLDGAQRLQLLALTRLRECGLRLPPSLLPAALEMGRRSVAVRAALGDTLGERGSWLARQNSAWSYAAGASEQASTQEQWDLGTLEQRVKLLAQLRQTDAAGARDKLAAQLKDLGAAERTALVPLLAVNLSTDDEAFLDGLMTKDRAQDVRQAAAALLTRLPTSRHAQAITTALAPLVVFKRGLIRDKLEIEAPTAADPSWKNEAIDATRPQHDALGERAWWLYQLARQCPLGWWQQHTGLAPADLLKASTKNQWHDALLRGWADAAVATQDATWAHALLHHDKLPGRYADETTLLAVLPLVQREQYWVQHMPNSKESLASLLQTIVAACPQGHVLSPALSQQLAQAIATELQKDTASNDYYLQQVLPEALCVLDLSAMDLGGAVGQSERAARVARVIAARRALAALTPAKPL